MPTGPRNKHTEPGVLEEPYGCNIDGCEYLSFKTLYDLRIHYNTLHSKEKADPHSKKFRCTVPDCGRTYKNLAGIKYHVAAAQTSMEPQDMLAHRGRPAKPKTEDEEALDGRMLVCPVLGCDSEYRQVSGLRYHLVRHDPAPSLEQLKAHNPDLAERLNGRGEAYEKAMTEANTNRPKPMRRPWYGDDGQVGYDDSIAVNAEEDEGPRMISGADDLERFILEQQRKGFDGSAAYYGIPPGMEGVLDPALTMRM